MKRLPQKRTALSVFPMPENGERVELNPPSLQWVAEPETAAYRVTLRKAGGETVFDGETRRNYLRLKQMLAPGEYRWNVFSGDAERGEWSFTVPEDAWPFVVPTAAEVLAKIPKEHPRHIHSREDLASLRERHPVELEILRRNIAIALADGVMAYPDTYRPDGRIDYRSGFAEARLFLDRDLVACALGYLLLGDRRAGEYARNALLRYCEWNPAGPCSIRGPWGDELGLSICRVFPAVLDWTWELYDERERAWIAATLRQHARQIYEHMVETDFLAQPGNSHSGRLPGYLGEIALVLADVLPREETERYLDYALEIYGSIFPHYGGRDGGWAEGPFYAASYTKWFLPFFFAIERHTGFSFLDKPFYRRVSQFFLHFAPPGQEAHPFGDGHWPTAIEWPGFLAQNPFGVYADRFGPELAREFSRRATAAIDHFELHLLDVFRPLPPEGRNRDGAAGEAAKSYLSRDAGLLSMRRDPADPEHDVAVLARCSRYGTPSHQHADQGNFAILIGGKALVVPSGGFGYAFGDDHHRNWTTQTVAQNCFLINGKGQPKNSADAVGDILEFSDDGRLCRARFDLAAAYPMLTKAERTLVFDREALTLELEDRIVAAQPVAVDFRLHSYAKPGTAADGAVTLRRGSREVILQVTSADPAVFGWTDRFVYPEGGTELPPRRELPYETHLNWRFSAARERVIKARFRMLVHNA